MLTYSTHVYYVSFIAKDYSTCLFHVCSKSPLRPSAFHFSSPQGGRGETFGSRPGYEILHLKAEACNIARQAFDDGLKKLATWTQKWYQYIYIYLYILSYHVSS